MAGVPLVRAVAGAIAFAALIAPTGAAGSTFPGQNGEIAFSSPSSGTCLHMVKPDGSGRHSPGACDLAAAARISPAGTRLETAVYDLVNDVFDIRISNLDGSDPVFIPGLHWEEPFVRWSPDGTRLAIVEQFSPSSCCDSGYLRVARADGSDGAGVGIGTVSYTGAWSNDGRVAYTYNDYDAGSGHLGAANADGSGAAGILDGPIVSRPEWSPSSDRLAFNKAGLAVINDDGTGLQQLNTFSITQQLEWAQDGQTILFAAAGEVRSVAPDGTQATNLTNHPADDQKPIWSPDGTKIAFESNRDGDYDIYVMNRDGSGVVQVTNDAGTDRLQDWQSIPVNSYPRPKGATPTQVSLVPAYATCTAPNRTHGPSLAFGSCNPPVQTSDELTVGTADANAKPTKSRGLVRYTALLGNPAAPPDEGDLRITFELADVYEQGTLADYAGEVRVRSPVRITDKLNTPHPGGPGAATVTDITFGATVACAPTADTTEGASCNLTTTADSLVPGTITEGRRSIWALGAAQVDDGGADGDADTPADNTLFMTQGLFVP